MENSNKDFNNAPESLRWTWGFLAHISLQSLSGINVHWLHTTSIHNGNWNGLRQVKDAWIISLSESLICLRHIRENIRLIVGQRESIRARIEMLPATKQEKAISYIEKVFDVRSTIVHWNRRWLACNPEEDLSAPKIFQIPARRGMRLYPSTGKAAKENGGVGNVE